ncbi:MAG TPA: isochorismatase family protein [Candidatus Lustribacter sp.]|jgi:nicotinamidase-related amidase|nr:isochorismatase family protein [Candidatus Lustribacter sp.]
MARVWDSFLTAQDKASLKQRPHQVWGFGERPALVLIDLYRWVFGDRRQPLLEAMKEWPGSCGETAWDALPHLQRLLGAARAAAIPVVHVTGLHPLDSGVTGWAESPGRSRINTESDPAMAERNRRRFDIVDEVAPLPGEVVLRKSAPSGFFGTLLMPQLNALHVDSIILVGESTSGCVRASCVDGRAYRFKMTVVEECVFDRHQAPHAINLFDMHEKYADVLGVDEVVAHLATLPRAQTAERIRSL